MSLSVCRSAWFSLLSHDLSTCGGVILVERGGGGVLQTIVWKERLLLICRSLHFAQAVSVKVFA